MSIRHLTRGLLASEAMNGYVLKQPGESNPGIGRILAGLHSLGPTMATYRIDQTEGIPGALLDEWFDLGLFSMTIPASLKGIGANMSDFCAVITELSQHDLSLGVMVVPHSGMGVKSILDYGSAEQKDMLLRNLAAERRLIAFALTETEAGSDVANHHATLRRAGETQFKLNGAKQFITNGSIAKTIVVCAKCPDLTPIPEGSVFVYLEPDDSGLTCSSSGRKLGIRGSTTSQLFFDDIIVGRDRLIGEPGKGLQQWSRLVDAGRMGVAAGSVGLAKKAFSVAEKTVENSPLRPFDRLTLAEIESKLFQMESLMVLGAMAHDHDFQDRNLCSAFCKVFCTHVCWEVVADAFQICGTQAILEDSELSEAVRGAPVLRITEGPNEVLLYRSGVDLFSSMDGALGGETSIRPFLHEKLRYLAAIFDELLLRFGRFMRTFREKYDRIVGRQFALNRLVWMTIKLAVLLSSLLRASALLKSADGTTGKIAWLCESLSRKTQLEIHRLLKEEESLSDSRISEIMREQEIINLNQITWLANR